MTDKLQKMISRLKKRVEGPKEKVLKAFHTFKTSAQKRWLFFKEKSETDRSVDMMDLTDLIEKILTLGMYCSIGYIIAEYRGQGLLFWSTLIASLFMLILLVWKTFCYITDIKLKQSDDHPAVPDLKPCRHKKRNWMISISGFMLLVMVYFFWGPRFPQYYASVTEVFGIPSGIGDSLTRSERNGRANYWKIQKFGKKKIVLTYIEPYEQTELMKQYSTAYNMTLFQPSARIVYECRKNVEKYRSLDEDSFRKSAKKIGNLEPMRVSYYGSDKKILMQLERNDQDRMEITRYSSDDHPQLLNSTLLRVPDENSAGNDMRAKQIEVTYNPDGSPLTQSFTPETNNLYSINGERYSYKDGRLSTLCYLDSDGNPKCNNLGVMMIEFHYDKKSGDLENIRYYGDETGTKRADGFFGVSIEKFSYDENGNLTERRQMNQNENWEYDVNHVYLYKYAYENGMLKESYYGIDNDPVREKNFHSLQISFEKYKTDSGQKIRISFDDAAVAETEVFAPTGNDGTPAEQTAGSDSAYFSALSGRSDSGGKAISSNSQFDSGTGQGLLPEYMQSDAHEKKTVDGTALDQALIDQEQDRELIRNYTSIQYILNFDNQITSKEYRDEEGQLVINEQGYAKVNYDHSQKNTVSEIYLDTESHPCPLKGGYAAVIRTYDPDGQIRKIEYQDVKKNPVFNRELGYVSVEYERSGQGTGQRIRESYYGLKQESVVIPEYGYAGKEQFYDGNGLLIWEAYYGQDGFPTYRADYNIAKIWYEYAEDGKLIREWYEDDNGQRRKRSDTGYEVVCREYDKNRLLKKISYNEHSKQALKPVNNWTTGIAIITYSYDDNGKKIEERYQDAEKKPCLRSDIGCAVQKYEYDENGNLCTLSFLDEKENPILRKDEGYAKIQYKYDSFGRCTSELYLDTEENPVINTKYHCAGFLYGYDEKENQARIGYVGPDSGSLLQEASDTDDQGYLGPDGDIDTDILMTRRDLGAARKETKYDGAGNVTGVSYYNAKGEPALLNEGYSSYKNEYEKGNLKKCSYFDQKGNLVQKKEEGYAYVVYDYDRYDQLTSIRYYGVDGEPVINTKYHCAGFRYQYDERGNSTEIRYIGLRSNSMTRSDWGFAYVKRTYDELGNLNGESYYDKDGRPVLLKTRGYSSYKESYENGRCTGREYFDTEGKPTLRCDVGYAAVQYIYDDQGRLRFKYYYGADHNRIISTTYNCAGSRYRYDDINNQIDVWYLDVDDKEMVRNDLGYAHKRSKYNNWGNLETEAYFDASGQPVTWKEGGFGYIMHKYDDKGNWVEARCFDKEDGNPVMSNDGGYSVIKLAYDFYGQRISEFYYDEEERPVISTEYNCAGQLSYYDERGNVTCRRYIGLNGKSMIRRDLGYSQINMTFDASGNELTVSYLRTYRHPVLCNDGGYAFQINKYEENHLVESGFYDTHRQLILRNDTGYAVVEYQYDKLRQCESASYYDTAHRSIISTEYLCAGFQYKYDTRGNWIDLQYIGLNGKRMTQKNLGYARVKKEYDEIGNLTGESYFDIHDQPTIYKNRGYASFKDTFINGLCTECRYFDIDGNLILRDDYGYAIKKNEYNDYGQCTSEIYLNVNEKPVISTEFHCAGMEYAYEDGRGNRTSTKYLDMDGKPMIRSDLGYAIVESEFDELGNETAASYYDANGAPTVCNEGYAYIKKSYDRGKETERRFFDSKKDGKLILRADEGYAILKYEYDDYGKCISESYYDASDKPVLNTKLYCSGSEWQYDKRGRVTAIRYKGLDGRLIKREDLGYAQITYKYDDSGNEKEVAYSDTDGKPAPDKKSGYSICKKDYDEDGRLKKSEFFSSSGNLVLRKDTGYAIVKYTYDGYGRDLSYSYYGAKQNPVIAKENHCASIRYTYDKYGNLSRTRYFGLDGKLMIREDLGYAQISLTYDNQGNTLSTAYFDTHGRPAISLQSHCAGIEYEFDNRGNQTDIRYLGKDGKLMMRRDLGYAQSISLFDSNGNKISIAYCDTGGHPAVAKDGGYAAVKYQYDARMYCTSELYYGIDGQPVISKKDGCAGFQYEYDQKGNRTDCWPVDKKNENSPIESLGYTHKCSEFDNRGNEISTKYYNTYVGNGYSYEYPVFGVFRYQYDEDGKKISESYYGTNNLPGIHTKHHCAGMKFAYDDDGNQTDTWYIGTNGLPMNREDLGYAQIHSEYDDFGNEISVSYFDADGNPVLCKGGGFASFEKIYKNSRVAEKRYFDTEKNLVLRDDEGCSIVYYEYDDHGQCISTSYRGIDGQPVINSTVNCASFVSQYDERGNNTKILYYGLKGELYDREDTGYACVIRDYDDHDNMILEKYLDSQLRPVRRKDLGYAKIQYEYNESGNQESTYFDENGVEIKK